MKEESKVETLRENGRRAVPYVAQMTRYDCGAACLAMAMGTHVGPPPSTRPGVLGDCNGGVSVLHWSKQLASSG
jgi:hypothetical protein